MSVWCKTYCCPFGNHWVGSYCCLAPKSTDYFSALTLASIWELWIVYNLPARETAAFCTVRTDAHWEGELMLWRWGLWILTFFTYSSFFCPWTQVYNDHMHCNAVPIYMGEVVCKHNPCGWVMSFHPCKWISLIKVCRTVNMLFYAFEFEHWTLGKDEIKVGYLLYSDTGHWNECNSLPCITWLLQECSTFGNYSYFPRWFG